MNKKSVCFVLLISCVLCVYNSWARDPIVPSEETMRQVEKEISRMVEEKEYNSTDDLSLYRCYGKIFVEANEIEKIKLIEDEIKSLSLIIERKKINTNDRRAYMIISLMSHDKQELKNIILNIQSGKDELMLRNLLETGGIVFKNLGYVNLPLSTFP